MPKDNLLYAENIALASLVSEYGTPLYVYSAADIRLRCQNLKAAFAGLQPHIHYSVKANSNLSILRLIHQQGLGFDIVSGGELARLQAADIPVNEIGFAGVGKTIAEIQQALAANIGFFTVESAPELERIARIAAEMRTPANVLFRLNPNVDPKTHKYISTGQAVNKFGLDFESANALCSSFTAHQWVKIVGFHMHLGSQIQEPGPYIAAVKKALHFIAARRAAGQSIEWLDIGGGFGIDYQQGEGLQLDELAGALQPLLQNQGLKIIIEPGRWLVARAGLLLMEVQYVKKSGDKTFVIVDAGMHTMLRPALYGGWHKIWPINRPEQPETLISCDVVGPVCESADFLAQDRLMPPVKSGDVLALFDAGAYGFVMTSNYNSHPRPAEALVEGNTHRLIRRREMYSDLIAGEIKLNAA